MLLRLKAHRQLVAKVAHSSITHARYAQVFAQGCRDPHIIVIQRHDAVDNARAREIAHAIDHIFHYRQIRHMEDFIDTFTRPVRLFQRWRDQQDYVIPLLLAFADKILPLFVTGNAEYGFWRFARHGYCS